MQQPMVFLVDEDAATRKSTARVMESASLPHVAFDSARSFLEKCSDAPGCLLLDLNLPKMSGMSLIQQLRERNYTLPILVITGKGTIPLAVQAIKSGVVDFLEKPVEPQVLIARVRAAFELDAQRRSDAAGQAALRQRLVSLTPRERELLKMLVGGASNKQIAADLGISIKTVENHRAHIMEKTGAANAADLVRISLLAGPA